MQIAYFRENRIVIDTDSFGTILDKVGDRPVVIVSISGPMRTGKSYLIGHFIRFLSAGGNGEWFNRKLDREFHWKNSADRQTTGILVWSEPFAMTDGAGRQVAVLLMDTQGCFDDQTTTNENSLVFALSCLLSSVLIYNFKNQLSEDLLQFLQLFIGYAKMSTESLGQQDEHQDVFSKLILLIRDWLSPIDFGFGYHDSHTSPAGSRNFKKEKLDVKDTMAPEVRIAHREIVTSFQSVACCLMPYPGNDLAYYDQVDRLEPMFVAAVRDFVPRVFGSANLVTKKIGGQELSGRDMKTIMHKWATLFRQTEIPPVRSVVESTAEVQNNMAFSIATKYYETEMQCVKTGEGLSDEAFEQLHLRHRNEAVDIFKRMKRLKHEEIQRQYFTALQEAIQKMRGTFEDINRTLRQFSKYKTESAEERQRLKEDMDHRIHEMEKKMKKNRGGFFSKLGEFVGGCLRVMLGSVGPVSIQGEARLGAP